MEPLDEIATDEFNSLKAKPDGKRYFEKIQPQILQRMNKKANCKSVIRAMKELALNISSKFGFSVSDMDTKYLDDIMEDIAMMVKRNYA